MTILEQLAGYARERTGDRHKQCQNKCKKQKCI